MSNNTEFKNDVSNRNLSAEMKQKIQRMRVMLKKDKSIVVDEDDSSDSDDDSWLDDEQWYCEKMAQWSGRVKVTSSIQQDPQKLKEFLQTRFRSKSC
jgi:hypothetical protein